MSDERFVSGVSLTHEAFGRERVSTRARFGGVGSREQANRDSSGIPSHFILEQPFFILMYAIIR